MRARVLCLVGVCLSFEGVRAESEEKPPTFGPAIAAGRELGRTIVARTGSPGAAIAVRVDDRLIWSEGFGEADVESAAPATPESRFRIASLSKLFTGTAVAKLADEGRLDLDRPVRDHVEGLPRDWRGMTTRHLVHHTSGIRHYAGRDDALDTTAYATTADALKRFVDRPLAHPPGEGETYSSYAYTVIAAVIEAVTGTDYLTFMEEELFQPLGMESTGPDLPTQIVPGRTGFYEMEPDGTLQNAAFVNLSGRWAGSGFLSTAEDLVRFGAAHTRPGFLTARALRMLATPLELPDGSRTKEGFGWGPREGWEGRRMLWGDGSTPGARAGLLVYPDQGLSIALLSNLRGARFERGELQAIAVRFLAAIDGRQVRRPSTALSRCDWTIESQQGDTPARLTLDWMHGRASGELDLGAGGRLQVVDGFIVRPRDAERDGRDDVHWLFTLHPQAGVVPLRLTARPGGLEGDLLRTGMRVSADCPE